MGLFDRFAAKNQNPEPGDPASDPAVEKKPASGGVLPVLAAAREKLKAGDLPAAMAIYEGVLATASERSDILMTISADLGTTGHMREIIELLAPRYDVEKHGAAAGINLLQAYLASRDAEAAQHLLDLLFALQRPDLEARLVGFSNVIAELFVSEGEAEHVDASEEKINLVSLSKPVWFYGLESLAPHLLPPKEGKLRRVAFAQCALPGTENTDALAARAEDALGRLSRSLPLWLADTFTYSAGYHVVAAVGSRAQHYALFPLEWAAENIRQLNESSDTKLDYVVTGALRNRHDDFELVLRIWEVKKFRELKVLTARWTPSTADADLRQLHEQLSAYMEWRALPAGQGLAYTAPASPLAYAMGLGASLSFFLGEKGVLAPDQLPPDLSALLHSARANPGMPAAQLALVAALLRLKAQGAPLEPGAFQHACGWLASDGAQAADVSALAVKLA
jgi:hypothetical protein